MQPCSLYEAGTHSCAWHAHSGQQAAMLLLWAQPACGGTHGPKAACSSKLFRGSCRLAGKAGPHLRTGRS